VKVVLEEVLSNFQQRVDAARLLAETSAKQGGEPSGWRDPDTEN
jgi:hypothetical protein